MGCSTSIFIAAEEEECVTLYSSVVKTKSFTCIINSTSGHVIVKFQWNFKRELLLSLTIMCYGTRQKNDTDIQNVFPKCICGAAAPQIGRLLLKSPGFVHTSF